MINVRFIFTDTSGRDISGTDEVDGYHWADYFDEAIQNVAQADSLGAADALLNSAYKGPDADGVGVRWHLENAFLTD